MNGEKEMIEFIYNGNLSNDENQFEGLATLQIVQKKMCFRGKCKFPSIESIKGTFVDGFLDGTVAITGVDKYFVTHGKIRKGVLHGRLVTFGWKPLYESRLNRTVHLGIMGR